MSSGPDVEAPGLGGREKNLLGGQIRNLDSVRNLIKDLQRQFKELQPILFEQIGLEPIISRRPPRGVSRKIRRTERKLEDVLNPEADPVFGPGGSITPPEVDRSKAKSLRERLKRLEKRQARGVDRITGFKLSEEAKELRDQLAEIESGFAERTLAALRGDIENPGLLRDIREKREQLGESLRRQLGPGGETSSAGIEQLGDFGERELIVKDLSRRQDLKESLGGLLFTGQDRSRRSGELIGRSTGLTQNPAIGALLQSVSAASGPLNVLGGLRGQQFSADLANAQNQQAGIGSLFGGFGALGGALLGNPEVFRLFRGSGAI